MSGASHDFMQRDYAGGWRREERLRRSRGQASTSRSSSAARRSSPSCTCARSRPAWRSSDKLLKNSSSQKTINLDRFGKLFWYFYTCTFSKSFFHGLAEVLAAAEIEPAAAFDRFDTVGRGGCSSGCSAGSLRMMVTMKQFESFFAQKVAKMCVFRR